MGSGAEGPTGSGHINLADAQQLPIEVGASLSGARIQFLLLLHNCGRAIEGLLLLVGLPLAAAQTASSGPQGGP